MMQHFNDMSQIEFNKIDPVVFEEGWPHKAAKIYCDSMRDSTT
jgi:hypothetical protein